MRSIPYEAFAQSMLRFRGAATSTTTTAPGLSYHCRQDQWLEVGHESGADALSQPKASVGAQPS